MREIGWGASDGTELFRQGHPWYTAFKMVAESKNLISRFNWQESEDFCKNDRLIFDCKRVLDGFDPFLETLGYRREGNYCRVERKNDKTIVIFSHGGSGTVAIARFLGMPFPYLCSILQLEFTSISKFRIVFEEGELVSPFITILNDHKHIEDIPAELVYH